MSDHKRSVVELDGSELVSKGFLALQVALKDISPEKSVEPMRELWKLQKSFPTEFKGETHAKLVALETEFFAAQGKKSEAVGKALSMLSVNTSAGMFEDRERNTNAATDLVHQALRKRGWLEVTLRENISEDIRFSGSVREAVQVNLKAAIQSGDEGKVAAVVIGALRAAGEAHRLQDPEFSAIMQTLRTDPSWSAAGGKYANYRNLIEAVHSFNSQAPDQEKITKLLVSALTTTSSMSPARAEILELSLGLSANVLGVERNRDLKEAALNLGSRTSDKNLLKEFALREYFATPDSEREKIRGELLTRGFVKNSSEFGEVEQKARDMGMASFKRGLVETIWTLGREVGEAIIAKQAGQVNLGRIQVPHGVAKLRASQELIMRNGFGEIVDHHYQRATPVRQNSTESSPARAATLVAPVAARAKPQNTARPASPLASPPAASPKAAAPVINEAPQQVVASSPPAAKLDAATQTATPVPTPKPSTSESTGDEHRVTAPAPALVSEVTTPLTDTKQKAPTPISMRDPTERLPKLTERSGYRGEERPIAAMVEDDPSMSSFALGQPGTGPKQPAPTQNPVSPTKAFPDAAFEVQNAAANAKTKFASSDDLGAVDNLIKEGDTLLAVVGNNKIRAAHGDAQQKAKDARKDIGELRDLLTSRAEELGKSDDGSALAVEYKKRVEKLNQLDENLYDKTTSGVGQNPVRNTVTSADKATASLTKFDDTTSHADVETLVRSANAATRKFIDGHDTAKKDLPTSVAAAGQKLDGQYAGTETKLNKRLKELEGQTDPDSVTQRNELTALLSETQKIRDELGNKRGVPVARTTVDPGVAQAAAGGAQAPTQKLFERIRPDDMARKVSTANRGISEELDSVDAIPSLKAREGALQDIAKKIKVEHTERVNNLEDFNAEQAEHRGGVSSAKKKEIDEQRKLLREAEEATSNFQKRVKEKLKQTWDARDELEGKKREGDFAEKLRKITGLDSGPKIDVVGVELQNIETALKPLYEERDRAIGGASRTLPSPPNDGTIERPFDPVKLSKRISELESQRNQLRAEYGKATVERLANITTRQQAEHDDAIRRIEKGQEGEVFGISRLESNAHALKEMEKVEAKFKKDGLETVANANRHGALDENAATPDYDTATARRLLKESDGRLSQIRQKIEANATALEKAREHQASQAFDQVVEQADAKPYGARISFLKEQIKLREEQLKHATEAQQGTADPAQRRLASDAANAEPDTGSAETLAKKIDRLRKERLDLKSRLTAAQTKHIDEQATIAFDGVLSEVDALPLGTKIPRLQVEIRQRDEAIQRAALAQQQGDTNPVPANRLLGQAEETEAGSAETLSRRIERLRKERGDLNTRLSTARKDQWNSLSDMAERTFALEDADLRADESQAGNNVSLKDRKQAAINIQEREERFFQDRQQELDASMRENAGQHANTPQELLDAHSRAATRVTKARQLNLEMDNRLYASYSKSVDTRLKQGLEHEAAFNTNTDVNTQVSVPHLQDRQRQLQGLRAVADREIVLLDQTQEVVLHGQGGRNQLDRTTPHILPTDVNWTQQRIEDYRKLITSHQSTIDTRISQVTPALDLANRRQAGLDREGDALRQARLRPQTYSPNWLVRTLDKGVKKGSADANHEQALENLDISLGRLTTAPTRAEADRILNSEIAPLETTLADDKAGFANFQRYRTALENTLNNITVRRGTYDAAARVHPATRDRYDALLSTEGTLNTMVENFRKNPRAREPQNKKHPIVTLPNLAAGAVGLTAVAANIADGSGMALQVDQFLTETRVALETDSAATVAMLAALKKQADGKLESTYQEADVGFAELAREEARLNAEIAVKQTTLINQHQQGGKLSLDRNTAELMRALQPVERELQSQGKQLAFRVNTYKKSQGMFEETISLDELRSALVDPLGGRMVGGILSMSVMPAGGLPPARQKISNSYVTRTGKVEIDYSYSAPGTLASPEVVKTLTELKKNLISTQNYVVASIILQQRAIADLFGGTHKTTNPTVEKENARLIESDIAIDDRLVDIQRLQQLGKGIKDPIGVTVVMQEISERLALDFSESRLQRMHAEKEISDLDYFRLLTPQAKTRLTQIPSFSGMDTQIIKEGAMLSPAGADKVTQIWIREVLPALNAQTAADAVIEAKIPNASEHWLKLAPTKTAADIASRILPEVEPLIADKHGNTLLRRRVAGGPLSGGARDVVVDANNKPIPVKSENAQNKSAQNGFEPSTVDETQFKKFLKSTWLGYSTEAAVVTAGASLIPFSEAWVYYNALKYGKIARGTAIGVTGFIATVSVLADEAKLRPKRTAEQANAKTRYGNAYVERNKKLIENANGLKDKYVSQTGAGIANEPKNKMAELRRDLELEGNSLAIYSGMQVQLSNLFPTLRSYVDEIAQQSGDQLPVNTARMLKTNLREAQERLSGGSSTTSPGSFMNPPQLSPSPRLRPNQ